MLVFALFIFFVLSCAQPIHRYNDAKIMSQKHGGLRGRHPGGGIDGAGSHHHGFRNNTLTEKHLPWKSIEMPVKSYFGGFPPPNDTETWAAAISLARKGSQLLLKRVREKINGPFDLINGDIHFRWLHEQADVYLSHTELKPAHSRDFKALQTEYFGERVPIAMLGYYEFASSKDKGLGEAVKHLDFGPEWLASIANFSHPQRITSRPYVGIGCPNENWGWLSTYFLNRTINWKHTFKNGKDIHKGQADQTGELRAFLDDPNLIMLVVNQHHNISHPKIISVPIGVTSTIGTWWAINKVLTSGRPKNDLLNSITSAWGARPAIKQCVFKALGIEEKRFRHIPKDQFYEEMTASMAVLCLPGLGYDSYRLSEALALGTMPIIERAVGIDRSVHKLPVLLIDDFAELTLLMIQQAYLEALYRAIKGEWEYQRITPHWWSHLLHETAVAGDARVLEERHPFDAIDHEFTRPMVPFDCVKMGGCGPGTKRVPKRSCAIDFDTNWAEYGARNMWTWAKR